MVKSLNPEDIGEAGEVVVRQAYFIIQLGNLVGGQVEQAEGQTVLVVDLQGRGQQQALAIGRPGDMRLQAVGNHQFARAVGGQRQQYVADFFPGAGVAVALQDLQG